VLATQNPIEQEGTYPLPEAQLDRFTRPGEPGCPPAVRELLQWGAGPRAGQQLVTAAQARAALDGRPAVTIADVRALAGAALEHRLVRSFAAESRAISTAEILPA
jgi:MoxR-like ATPase